MYFGVEKITNNPGYLWCDMNGSTDTSTLDTHSRLSKLGTGIYANTSIGKYEIHVAKIGADKQGDYCVFDIVRQR